MKLEFKVLDSLTGEAPLLRKIILNEEWARNLSFSDPEGFALMQDGTLVLMDQCGNYAECPMARFKVFVELKSEPMDCGDFLE